MPAQPRAALPKPPPARRLEAWLRTGPLGHLWSTGAEVVLIWARLGRAGLRKRVERYSKR